MFTGSLSVTISTTTPGATIYYSTDGSPPATQYSGAVVKSVEGSYPFRAYATKTDMTDSEEAIANYTVQWATVETPILAQAGECDKSVC